MVNAAKQHDAPALYLRPTVPGIGNILSLGLLEEMHDLSRLPRVQDLVSSGRLGKCAKAAAGKRSGSSGTKIGHAYLTWACSEAAVLFLRANPAGQQVLTRLENTHGQGQALPVLAQTLARAVYSRLTRNRACDRQTLLHGYGSGARAPRASLDSPGPRLHRALYMVDPRASRTPKRA
jgi:hypothetical protein